MKSDEYEKFADETHLQQCVREGELMLQYQNHVVDSFVAMVKTQRKQYMHVHTHTRSYKDHTADIKSRQDAPAAVCA